MRPRLTFLKTKAGKVAEASCLSSTVEFLGVWERLNNPAFNPVEFDGIRMQTGLNSFVLTPKQWIEKTGAVGLTSSAGRYGGTYAHKDIAFEFAAWVSVEFKLYLIKEFQRLKDEENDRLKLDWNLQRTLAKINYRSFGVLPGVGIVVGGSNNNGGLWQDFGEQGCGFLFEIGVTGFQEPVLPVGEIALFQQFSQNGVGTPKQLWKVKRITDSLMT